MTQRHLTAEEYRARLEGKKRRPIAMTPNAPWPCVILAVDTAENSGWSIWRHGEIDSWGEVDLMMRDALYPPFQTLNACFPNATKVLVLELPFRGNSQGQWIGHWKHEWTVKHSLPRTKIVQVNPQTWRCKVIGLSNQKRDEMRKLEQQTAKRIIGMRRGELGTDEAAAICIGKWASWAPQVGSKLTAKQREVRVS